MLAPLTLLFPVFAFHRFYHASCPRWGSFLLVTASRA